jgi:HEPN domain
MRLDCVRSRISLTSPTTSPVSLPSKIEKALKAVLTARDMPFERSHDIDYLCDLIESAGLDLTPELKAAVALTPWVVEFRYADPYDVAHSIGPRR